MNNEPACENISYLKHCWVCGNRFEADPLTKQKLDWMARDTTRYGPATAIGASGFSDAHGIALGDRVSTAARQDADRTRARPSTPGTPVRAG
jgi:hypothetical protein